MFYKAQNNIEAKRPISNASVLWKVGAVVSSDDLPGRDIERFLRTGDLKPLGAAEAKRDAAYAQTQFDTLQFRQSKGLHVDLRHFEETERQLKSANAVARSVAG
jgi:hypothetical protein